MRRSSRLAAQAKAAEEAPPAPVLAPEAPARPPKTSRARKPKVPVPAISVKEAADEALEIKFQAEEIKQPSSDQPSSEEEEEEEEYDPEEDVAPIRKAPRRKPRGGASTSAPRQSRPAPSSRPVNTNVQESGMSLQQINWDMEALAEEGTVNLNGRITVTRAKNEYLLTDRDIADLEFIKRKNPHHPDAHPMRLFLVREIVKTSYMKHGGAAGLEAAREMKELRKAGRGRDY